MVLDIIIVAFFLIFVIIGIKSGAAKTLLKLVGTLLAVFLASSFGSVIAKWIYEGFFQKGIINSINTAIEQSGTGDALQSVANSLPDLVYNALSLLGISKESLISQTENAANASQATISQTFEGIISPVLTSIISFFVIIILFILLSVLFKFLIRLLLNVFELPVLHTVNRLLGGVLGALEGVAVVYLMILLIRLILPFAGDDFFITEQLINQSVLFKAMYNIDIFGGITQLINGTKSLTANNL